MKVTLYCLPLLTILVRVLYGNFLSCLSFSPASGLLKGFDPLLNLVLDEATEYLRGKLVLDGWLTFPLQQNSISVHFALFAVHFYIFALFCQGRGVTVLDL